MLKQNVYVAPITLTYKGGCTTVTIKSLIADCLESLFIDYLLFAFVKIPFSPSVPTFRQYELRFSLLKYSQPAG